MPAESNAYILRHGESRVTNLVAGQMVRTLADTRSTDGGFGAVLLESTIDRQPIPLHYHVKEHDTWLCTRGRLQVWCGDQSRILTDGDFAYVQPGDIHAYRCLSPRTQFFGIVAPGGWEGFFDAAGEKWEQPGLPEANHPFDFSRMGPAMGRYGVMRAEGATYAEAANGDATDRNLPEGPASYFLQQGYGLRLRAMGHLSTTLLTRAVSRDHIEMRVIEGLKDAAMPALRHDQTHVFLYVLEGKVALTLGSEETVLHAGDSVNIPAGTDYGTTVVSGHARWVLTSAHGNGLDIWDRLGRATETFSPAAMPDETLATDADLGGIDVRLAL